MEEIVKTCANCEKTGDIRFFPKQKGTKDGHHIYCQKCLVAINKENRIKRRTNGLNKWS